jgi:peptide/nickel transport system ATP-binding protein
MADQQKPLLEVTDLSHSYSVSRGLGRGKSGLVRAVDGVSFHIDDGETLGLVGESGCGKTTTGRCILRVVTPTSGRIIFRLDGAEVAITELGGKSLKAFRRHMQMIFQDPYSSLNPRMTVLEIVGEPLLVHGVARGRELEDRVERILVQVGLKQEYLRRYPHSFSGGQRQRIGIARALILNPHLVVADEPVSALDVSIQAQIINLLKDLQHALHLTYLFIAHDVSVVKHISNRIMVMYLGRLVEIAPTRELIRGPRHPYTEALLSAVPRPNPHYRSDRIIMKEEAPDLTKLASGCVFNPRCRYAREVCRTEVPRLVEVSPARFASCHLVGSLSLRGI